MHMRKAVAQIEFSRMDRRGPAATFKVHRPSARIRIPATSSERAGTRFWCRLLPALPSTKRSRPTFAIFAAPRQRFLGQLRIAPIAVLVICSVTARDENRVVAVGVPQFDSILTPIVL